MLQSRDDEDHDDASKRYGDSCVLSVHRRRLSRRTGLTQLPKQNELIAHDRQKWRQDRYEQEQRAKAKSHSAIVPALAAEREKP
jgi:hypothetical protein